MIGNYIPSAVEYLRFLPEIILTCFGLLIMMLSAVTPEHRRSGLGVLALVGALAALWANVVAFANPGQSFQHMLTTDAFATFFRGLVLVVGILCLLSSFSYLRRERAEAGEFYALILFSLVGQCILATANDLIIIFIAIEISSIATYVLAGFLRDDPRNNESALKYFLLGSFATAFLLYGAAWMYGLVGNTNLDEIRRVLSSPEVQISPVLIGLAAALIFVGLAFKVSAAPFQIWAPDVYQGAPAPVSAFMSAGPKAAAFAVMLRILMSAFAPVSSHWTTLIWVSALLTMIIGNFAALQQTNIKRLLAYSSIAHAGYVLVALTANSQIGAAAAMFYLAAYAFMNVGAFAVVTHIANKQERYVRIDDLAGLAKRQPLTAGLLALFLFSLIGVPLTGGFFGKFYIFKAALDANLVWLTVLGLLNSAVAAYYYLKVIVAMYMREPGEAMENLPPLGAGLRIALWSSALGTLILGIFPGALLDFVSYSVNAFK